VVQNLIQSGIMLSQPINPWKIGHQIVFGFDQREDNLESFKEKLQLTRHGISRMFGYSAH